MLRVANAQCFRFDTGQKGKYGGTEAINIALGNSLASQLLRSNIALLADHRASCARLEMVGSTKVDQEELTFGTENEVVRRHVPVNDRRLLLSSLCCSTGLIFA